MKMTSQYRAYRNRITNMAKFERDCRKTMFQGREVKAYLVPGTPEAGRHAQYVRDASDAALREAWHLYV